MYSTLLKCITTGQPLNKGLATPSKKPVHCPQSLRMLLMEQLLGTRSAHALPNSAPECSQQKAAESEKLRVLAGFAMMYSLQANGDFACPLWVNGGITRFALGGMPPTYGWWASRIRLVDSEVCLVFVVGSAMAPVAILSPKNGELYSWAHHACRSVCYSRPGSRIDQVVMKVRQDVDDPPSSEEQTRLPQAF
jgi:hypothetical protein